MERANEALDSTGFCARVLPFGLSVLVVSTPVSQRTLDRTDAP